MQLQDFPSEDILESGTPAAAPLLGAVGRTFFGESINGPLEGGFPEGQVCTEGAFHLPPLATHTHMHAILTAWLLLPATSANGDSITCLVTTV